MVFVSLVGSWKALENDDSVQPTLVRMPKNKYPVNATAI
jgi:hypothetical protein